MLLTWFLDIVIIAPVRVIDKGELDPEDGGLWGDDARAGKTEWPSVVVGVFPAFSYDEAVTERPWAGGTETGEGGLYLGV